MLKNAVLCAVIGSAAAFSPSMVAGPGRREVVQGAGAAAVVAPLLRPAEADAAFFGKASGGPRKPLTAPVISILDHRGCSENSKHQEYKGKASSDENDEMCIVVRQQKISVAESDAAKLRQEYLSFKASGLLTTRIWQQGPNYQENFDFFPDN
uniref:Phycoerythrin alpha chain domain-containing protein n=1 Tax=Hemiselmis tepida TaxID=464990 RepID=A0A7S0Z6P5_9CRYP|mmetsp:Transcript_6971/g.17727  ORF Transcript_6971/g.17727 Transcript_6971/m.17727 type:complete len:153 (+) Transcript_6971:38-496(+)